MATRRNPSRAAGTQPVPDQSQNHPPEGGPVGGQPPNSPPTQDRVAQLEGQVQHLTELLTTFLTQQQRPEVRQGEHSNHDSQHQGDNHSSHRELRGEGSPRGARESHRDGRGSGPPGVASMEGRAQRRSSLVPIIHGLEAPSGNGVCDFWKERWQQGERKKSHMISSPINP